MLKALYVPELKFWQINYSADNYNIVGNDLFVLGKRLSA